MKDCILLSVKDSHFILDDWKYIVSNNGMEFRKTLLDWFNYQLGDTAIYVLRDCKISEVLSINDKQRFDELMIEGLPIVNESSRGLKIVSYMDLMNYLADISGYTYLKELGLSDLDKEDYSKYREKVFQKWYSPYLINPFILYDLKEFNAPSDLSNYWCSCKDNEELSKIYNYTRLGYYTHYAKLWYRDLYCIFSKGKELEFQKKYKEYKLEWTKKCITESYWNLLDFDVETYILRWLMRDYLTGNFKPSLFESNVKKSENRIKLVVVKGGKDKTVKGR